MNSSAWATPTDSASAARRAGGRRRYNAMRKTACNERRQKVATLFEYLSGLTDSDYGIAAAIARELGVNRSTITRDLAALHADLLARDESTLALAAAAVVLRVTTGDYVTTERFTTVAEALQAARQYTRNRTTRVEVLEGGESVWSYPAAEVTP